MQSVPFPFGFGLALGTVWLLFGFAGNLLCQVDLLYRTGLIDAFIAARRTLIDFLARSATRPNPRLTLGVKLSRFRVVGQFRLKRLSSNALQPNAATTAWRGLYRRLSARQETIRAEAAAGIAVGGVGVTLGGPS